MKITIEKEFTSAGEAAVWLQRFFVAGAGSTVTIIPPRQDLPVEEAKPPRKPRNDAGKPRGSYLEKAKAGVVASGTLPVEAVAYDGVANRAQYEAEAAHAAQAAPESEGAATVSLPPTKEDALAALKRMADKEGFGTPACIKHLKEFKVSRLSELKPESYPLFIKQIDEKLTQPAE